MTAGYKGVQIVTISRPTAYGEYAPYQFVDTEQEFEIMTIFIKRRLTRLM